MNWLFFLTFLKFSRVHGVLPKAWRIFGCWVFATTVTNIRWNSIGKRYQLHWPNTKSNRSNSFETISPNSHTRKMMMPDQNIKNKIRIISAGTESELDFRKGKGKKIKLKFCFNFNRFNQFYSTSSNWTAKSEQQMRRIDQRNMAVKMMAKISLNAPTNLNAKNDLNCLKLSLKLEDWVSCWRLNCFADEKSSMKLLKTILISNRSWYHFFLGTSKALTSYATSWTIVCMSQQDPSNKQTPTTPQYNM